MTALLVLSERAPPALEGAERRRVALVPGGIDPQAAWWTLLGQDPATTWSGPAPLALASAGLACAADETAYALRPVRVEGGRVIAEVEWAPGLQRAAIERLREALEGEGLGLHATPWGMTLIVPEPYVGPPLQAPPPALVGAAADALPAGPPALLRRALEAARRVCADAPGPATHLLATSPAGPPRTRPLREAWLGLGPVAAVGDEAWARALETLLGAVAWPCAPEHTLALARERRAALVVARLDALEPGAALPERVAVAGPPGADGAATLTWRGGALGAEGPQLLRPWCAA